MTSEATDIGSLLDATTAAAAILTAPPRRGAALTYLKQRGIGIRGIPAAWPLGYAPPGWTRLVEQLRGTFPDEVLLDAGIARRSSRGTLIDTFRDRVIFPVHDSDGRIAGFVGRDLSGAPQAPKYLNTCQTSIYDKGSLLYGLSEARMANPEALQPVIVEGSLDVLAITARQHASRVTELLPVASCGTAFTSAHAALIARAVDNSDGTCVVAMDGDAAGRSAATNAGEILRAARFDVRVVVLPNGLDPAAYLAQPDTTLATFRASNALPLLAFHVERAIATQGDRVQWVEGRLAASRAIASYLTTYPVDFTAAQIGWISRTIGVDTATMTSELVDAYSATKVAVASEVKRNRSLVALPTAPAITI